MKKQTTILTAGLVVVCVVLLGIFLSQEDNAEPTFGAGNPYVTTKGNMGVVKDVIGNGANGVSTSTTGVAFTNLLAASTTYPIFIGAESSEAVITLMTTAVSYTPSVVFSILASNDYDCATASTTYHATFENKLTTDINWFDASVHIKDLAGAASVTNKPANIAWLPTAVGDGESIILTNLNTQCLAIKIAATSTSIYSQIVTK